MIKTSITGGQYDDPREYQDDTPQCKNCGMNDKMDDMDVCSGCSDEFDEWDETALDSYCTEHNFNKKTYKYE